MKLPLEYNKLSDFFDVVGSGSRNAVNRVIEKFLRKYKTNAVLDLTCGTGSQVIFLSKKGFKITGSDYSAKLITQARKNIKKANIKAKLYQGDMRTQKLGEFDAVITIFNAIGHLTPKGFEKALRNIHKNLKPQGIYIFDIFNLESFNSKDVSSLDVNKRGKINGVKIHIYQYSELNKKKGLLISHDNYDMFEPNKKPKKFSVKFPMQIYTASQLQDKLTRNGFEILGFYNLQGKKFSKKHTKEILTVARKI